MILVLPFCQKDKATAVRLAEWMAELGGTEKHDLLLAYHEDTTPEPIHEILKPHFNHVGGFKIVDSETNYPAIANIMWHECVKKVADAFNMPWFWMEPDAVPLVPDWLDRIEEEYKAKGKPFMLDRVITPTRSHNSGVGVYPGRVRDFTMRLWELSSNIPWDVFLADDFTPFTHHTSLIHDKFYQVWEDPKSGPPVFPTVESLSIIESSAVLFHRNKDGSLMDRLRESRGGVSVARSHSSAAGACSSQAPATDDKAALLAKIAELEARLAVQAPTISFTSEDRPVEAAGKKPEKKQKRNISPEVREAASQRMKAMLAKKRAVSA